MADIFAPSLSSGMIRTTLVLALPLLMAGCAQVKEPQGGPKDTAPPALLDASPAYGSTQFTGNRIVLRFDERVKLDRVRERLLVSPPLALPPTVVAKGNEVVLALNAPLAANTTYTFHIGEAVTDLSEGNAATGFSYVVSTGAHLDSLVLGGRVWQASSGLPADGVLVVLQDASDTGDVRTMPPAYFTRAGSDGRFKLTHLRGGAMRLYALRDRNGNYRFDLPGEEVAFADSAVFPGDSTAHTLWLFQPQAEKQMVVAAKVLPERGWQLVTARRAGQLTLHSLDREGGTLQWWPEWNTGRDTVVLWPSDTTLLQGQRFILKENNQALDTLAYRATGGMPFNLGLVAKRDPSAGTWYLESTRPIAAVDPGHALLMSDTVQVPWQVPVDSIHGRTIGIGTATTTTGPLQLTLYPKAVTARMGGTNDTTRLTLGAVDPKTLGRLKVEITVDTTRSLPGPFVFQLMAAQGRVVREATIGTLPGVLDWTGLAPGSYSLRLIEDRDGNGRWDTGSLHPKRQPERVIADEEPVVVRAGWSVEHSWTLGEIR